MIKSTETNPAHFRRELSFLDDLQKQVWLISDKAKNLFSPSILKSFIERVDKIEYKSFFLKSSAMNWLKEMEPEKSVKSVCSNRTKSSKGSKSSSYSSSSSHSSRKVVEEAVELAALKVGRDFAEGEGITEQIRTLDE